MNRIKRYTAAVIAVMMALVMSVQAQVWVNVSSWAYNDVSAFTNEGLLPDGFGSVSDYRENITRGQFAELVYAIMEASHSVTASDNDMFDDVEGKAEILGAMGIISGTGERTFSPDAHITRQDAAVILFGGAKAVSEQLFDFEGTVAEFQDNTEIAEYAYEAVSMLRLIGVISGDDKGYFNPLNNITIEQAIIMIYRTYLALPYTVRNDGANVGVTEEVVLKAFGNGYYETKEGNKLFITDGITRLMEFETDIYSSVECYANSQGEFVMAKKHSRETDVYNLKTTEYLYTIPYPVLRCTDGYIYVTAKDNSAMFGVYTYEGEGKIHPRYSMESLYEAGYYDIYEQQEYVNEREVLITDQKFMSVPGMEKGTYVGSWAIPTLVWEDDDIYYEYEYDRFKAVGIDLNGINCVAVLTNFNGQVLFNMTWLGMSDEAAKKMYEIESREEKRMSDLDEINAIIMDTNSYTDVYHLTLTKINRSYGNEYGVEGTFTLTRNGEICFENAEGIITNMPSKNKSESYGADLQINFDKDGVSYVLTSTLMFESSADEKTQESQKRSYLLEKSPQTKELYRGNITKAIINGEELNAINNDEYGRVAVSYNRKYGIAKVDIGDVSDKGSFAVTLDEADDVTIGDNSISGMIYVAYTNMIMWNGQRGLVEDAFEGTVSGINDDKIRIKSDDGKYDIEIELIEKSENEATKYGEARIYGTREPSEFITDEPYFIGTAAEQDEFDLEEHEGLYRRIVVDENGKVLFVVPIENQNIIETPDEYKGAATWRDVVKGLAYNANWVISDPYMNRILISLKNQYWEAEY